MDIDGECEPSAWPEQPATLRAFDSACRCPICYDLFDTPKCLPCGHSFCHTCITSNLEYQMSTRTTGKPCCPSCRGEADLMDLTNNLSLAHVIKSFAAARSNLLNAVRSKNDGSDDTKPPSPPEIRAAQAALPRRSNRKRSRSNGGGKRRSPMTDVQVVDDSADESDDPDFDPKGHKARENGQGQHHNAISNVRKPPAGKVECPICGGFFPQGEIAQRHVEVCLVRGQPSSDAAHNPITASEPIPKLETIKRLPKIAFNIMKLNQLVDTLRRVGLPVSVDGRPGTTTRASRELLEKRYTELRREIDRAIDSKEAVSQDDLIRKVLSAERQVVTANKASTLHSKYGQPGPKVAIESKILSTIPNNSHAALIKSMRERQALSKKAEREKLSNDDTPIRSANTDNDVGYVHLRECASEECMVIDDSDIVADSAGEDSENCDTLHSPKCRLKPAGL